MSRKKKMLRFAELETFENVFQCVDSNSTTVKTFDGSSKEIKGHWSEQVFHNDHPLIRTGLRQGEIDCCCQHIQHIIL